MATPESNTQKRPHEYDVIPVLVRFDNENRPVQYIYVNKNEVSTKMFNITTVIFVKKNTKYVFLLFYLVQDW